MKRDVLLKLLILLAVPCLLLLETHSVRARDIDYATYLRLYENTLRPDVTIDVPITQYSSATAEVEVVHEAGGRSGEFLKIGEAGSVGWWVFVPEAGLYNIAMDYYPIEGRKSEIQRELRINGELPFLGAKFLTFFRVWADEGEIRVDNRGNELRARQTEAPRWQTVFFSDDMGYYMEPYLFYFGAGWNKVELVGRREPLLIGGLRLTQAKAPLSYEMVQQSYSELELRVTTGRFVKVQGEHAAFKSDSTLYPIFDKGDRTVEPYHPALIRLNTIGGWRWSTPGQWISWEVDIPEDGLYIIALKSKQDQNRAAYSSRRLYINGTVPFAEVEAIKFAYSNQYQMRVLGLEEQGEPYLFYFQKGTNEIKLEVVLGDIAELLVEAEDCLFELNEMYRKIVMITSPTPDPWRDYQLERRIPGVISNLSIQGDRLDALAQALEDATGQRGGNVALLRDLARQLKDMAARPATIPKRLEAYRDNIASLGTWIMDTSDQPLQIDYLIVASPDQTLPRAQPTIAETVVHEIKAFAASFSTDYELVGDVHDPEEYGGRQPLTVWVSSGRDQATAVKEMIEDTFTAETGILVNLQLVNMGTLLPATLAGMGPDVALGVPISDPINFALRNAVEDLSKYPGFEDVRSRFMSSALVPLTFRDAVYALPEQQTFPVMFYRTDILAEKGLAVPQTWNDVARLIPDLQKEHMNFGLPISDPRARQAGSGDIGVATSGAGSLAAHQGVVSFLTFLYQKGGELYLEDGIATNLDSEIAVEAFREWTDLYELYNLPQQYDAVNRFRTGDIPILIASYTMCNQLSVAAPEIRGRWDFTLVPGTRREDGTIDRSVPGGIVDMSSGAAAIILSSAKNKEDAWEFLKWWTSAETQLRYGRELESLLGPAARYPTANVEAMSNLPWTVEELDKLFQQWSYVRGVPEVPGGYMVGRHLDNAFRKVVLHKAEPRKTLLDYARVVNEEITVKRREFGLETMAERKDSQ